MIENICDSIVERMKRKLPDIDEEKGQVINYGLQVIIGELPKIFLIFVIGFILGIGELTLLTFFLLLPYRSVSGGFHLKTHLGCIIGSTLFFCGIPFISKIIILEPIFIKYTLTFGIWIFGIIMCRLYAPADTENVPIIDKKIRNKKRIISYIMLTVSLLAGIIINDRIISNILIFGVLFQSITITRLAYHLTNNKYGHEEYDK